MSIQSEITRLTNKRNLAFDAIEEKGVAVPSNSTMDDLPDLIALIQEGTGVLGVTQDSSGYLVLDSASSGDNGVFYADYGTTTNAEIAAAYQAGKACFCKVDTGTVLQLFYPYSATYHVFTAAYDNTIYIVICNNSSWSKVTRQLAKTSDVPTDAADIGAIAAPSSPTAGQFLVYDGTAWVAQTVPSASGVSF